MGGAELARAQAGFEAAHRRAYGYVAAEDPIELVNLRLSAVGRLPDLPRHQVPPGDGDPSRARKGERRLWMRSRGEARACPVYDRYALRSGDTVPGTAVIEEMDASTVVPEGYSARVDGHGNLVIGRE